MSNEEKAFSDAQLICMVRQGDADAFAELGKRYLWLIHSKARMFEGASAPEKEDLWQEGFLGLHMAAATYREQESASFPTYAGVCIYNRMATAARRYASKKNKPLNESLSLDTAGLSDLPTALGPETALEMRESFLSLQKKIEAALSPFERKVLRLYLGGYRRGGIAERTGVPLKTVDNALHRVRRKLKNL